MGTAATVKRVLTLSAGSDRQRPTAPSSLSISAASGRAITVSWAASRDDVSVAGYGVYLNNTRVGSTKNRSFAFAQLTCGTTYQLGVDAFDAAGRRSKVATVLAATAPCLDITPPGAPPYVRQASGGKSGVSIEWAAAADNVGVAGYSVYRAGVPVAATQQTSLWLGGLVCGAGYSVAVEAYDAAGNRSPRTSAVVTTDSCGDTTPPTAARDVAISASTASTISVSWQPSSDNNAVAGYRTFVDGRSAGETTGTTKTFDGLQCGLSYTVKIVAFDAAGNESAPAGTIAATSQCPAGSSTDQQPPTTPTGVAQTGGSAGSVAVSWSPSTDNVRVAGYGIYRSGAKLGDATSTSFTLGGLTCATSLEIAVDAVDPSGNRSARKAIMAATSTCEDTVPPPPPTGLAQLGKTETSITLGWAASNAADGAGYRLFRDATLIATTTSTSYAFTGLTCGASYTFGVEAFDAAGNHSSRSATMLTTSACSDTAAPTSPASLQATGSTATSVALSWGASTDNVGVSGYSLYLGGTLVGTTQQTSYSFAALTCGTSYTVGVEAFDAAGNRSARASVPAMTATCGTPLPSPSSALYLSPSGSDASACTQAAPCLSFGRAYTLATPGTTVLVAAGTYGSQEISRDPAKLTGAPVVFQPAGGTVTVTGVLDFGQEQFNRLGPANVTVRDMTIRFIRSWAGSSELLWENIDAAQFDVFDSRNVTIRGGDYGPCEAPRDDLACVNRIAGTSSNVVVDGVNIHDFTSTDLINYHVDGMFIRGGSDIVVRNSKFWGNMITNIRVQSQPCCDNARLLIENNWFNAPLQGDGVSPRSDAINIDTPVVGGVTIQFNSFAENAGPQVTAPALIKGNLMQNMACPAGVTFSYNVYIPFSLYTGQTPCGTTDKRVSTFGYVTNSLGGAFDYRLLASATDGVDYVPTASSCPGTDFEGTARPQGGACDAGADER